METDPLILKGCRTYVQRERGKICYTIMNDVSLQLDLQQAMLPRKVR